MPSRCLALNSKPRWLTLNPSPKPHIPIQGMAEKLVALGADLEARDLYGNFRLV